MSGSPALRIQTFALDRGLHDRIREYLTFLGPHADCATCVAVIMLRDALKSNVIRVIAREEDLHPEQTMEYYVSLLEYRSQYRPDMQNLFREKFRKYNLTVQLDLEPGPAGLRIQVLNAFSMVGEEQALLSRKLKSASGFADIFTFFEERDLIREDPLREEAVRCLSGWGVSHKDYELNFLGQETRASLLLPLPLPPADGLQVFDLT
ncbi:MAG: hypothetical protein HS115_03335 [Spirochaetales bacterium]|nr:hypothetical protein [Spirochaetales bacterium]